MGNLGFSEMLIILLVALLIFGAKRLPEIGSSIGKGIREFKRSLSDASDALSGIDERQGSGRTLDAPPSQTTTSSGEPKRLSQ